MIDTEHTEVRCPGDREHTIKGTEYSTCGQLPGGIGSDSSAIYRCPVCKSFWQAVTDDGNLDIFKINTKTNKIKFKKQWRVVHDEQ